MTLIAEVRGGSSNPVLDSLQSICDSHGLGDLSSHLADLADLVQWDMKDMEESLDSLPYAHNIVHKSAEHLVSLGGKRLRPMCVALASRLGSGFGNEARAMGVAVELVHCATLLHDDVIDLGDERRGSPSARTVYGNAASIFAGDWLLIESLKRVREANVPGVLARLLDVIDEMISAEAIQLENRACVDIGRENYFRVAEGKTAALFRWAMFAGGRAGGLDLATCTLLEQYGLHLGVAFQLVDDALDYSGSEQTGKLPFADLREGKMTYPAIVAIERDPSLRPILEEIIAGPNGSGFTAAAQAALLEGLRRVGALEETRNLALERARLANEALSTLPESRGRSALLTVAATMVHRES